MSAYLLIKDVSVVFRFRDEIPDVLSAVVKAIQRGMITTSHANTGEAVLINFALVTSVDVDAEYDGNAMMSKPVWPTSVEEFFPGLA